MVLHGYRWRSACSADERVPSFSHELLVDLFRACGELAPVLLEHCAGLRFEHDRIEQGPADLSQVASTEYRADRVILLRNRDQAAIAGVIVEVQRGIDAVKRRAWPVYVTALHADHDCPVFLLVLAPEPQVARWARKPISLGHPGFCLEPLVIGFPDVPRIIDPSIATKLPELGVLSVLAHPELEVATVAVAGISSLPEDRARLYLDVILSALPAPLRELLEDRMKGYQYQSDFARKYYGQGLEEGRERGIEEGRERGLEEGRERGLRAAVREFLRVKLDEIAPGDEAAITGMHDDALVQLIGALGRATSAAEARAALAACSSPA